MSVSLNITSDLRDANQFPSTSDFRVQFSKSLQFDQSRPWTIALAECTVTNSIPNIDLTDYNNATFKYNNGVIDQQFNIPTGTYSFAQLNTEIKAQITALGDDPNNITFTPSYSTLKTTLTIAGGYSVDFSVSDLYLLFGFSAAQAGAPIVATTIGANPANISNDVDTLLIRCDLITESYNNSEGSDILHTFVPDTPPGSVINVVPFERMYLRMQQREFVDSIRIYITDQLDRPVSFRGETCTFRLHLKQEEQ